MVTVLGENGYLGAVVKRRWAELGIDGPWVVNCIRPDDVPLTWYHAEQGWLIQPSTDAIAEDTLYARTKRIIECAPATIIRAGIVDIRNQPAIAYRNWFCNPLTPLEWADYAASVRGEKGTHAIGREPLTRFDVAELVAEVFDTPRPVAAVTSVYNNRIQPFGEFPPLRDALITFRQWLEAGAERERMAGGHA